MLKINRKSVLCVLTPSLISCVGLVTCSESYVEPPLNNELKKGKAIVQRDCAVCHIEGLRDAPLLGDSKAWSPRIAKGEDELLKNAISGYNMMPSRGANPELTDVDLLHAIRYMMLVSNNAK